ncbi:MAG: PAS domain-containing protein [Thermodesulfobacteriota bacterium]|nr:PAS domain-containing protein [Thermodesulfobacteriota bacterium]
MGVTGTKDLEKDHKQMENILSVMYDALHSSVNGVIITDPEGRITYVNQASLRYFGYRHQSELLDKNATDFFPTASVKRFTDVKSLIDESRGETEEFIVERKTGQNFPWRSLHQMSLTAKEILSAEWHLSWIFHHVRKQNRK